LEKVNENKIKPRSFPLFGLGLSWHTGECNNIYANFSQAYNGVNFNDIRVINPNFKVDPNLKDMKGYNVDFGFRGRIKKYVNFDLGGFFLAYNDRIGVLTLADANYNVFRYRTNIADARSIGAELYLELNVIQCFAPASAHQLSIYGSGAWIEAYYLKSAFKSVEGKYVEYAPRYSIRSGIQYKCKGLQISVQHSYTADQFTDATNAKSTPTAVNGIIPAYSVLDFTASYKLKRWFFSASCNNVLNQMYFTRRADGYPGPGILPADPRNVTLTLGFKW
jgi:Fe(3+) dicitrate transport protein